MIMLQNKKKSNQKMKQMMSLFVTLMVVMMSKPKDIPMVWLDFITIKPTWILIWVE